MKKEVIKESIKTSIITIISIFLSICIKNFICIKYEGSNLCEWTYELTLILLTTFFNILIYCILNRYTHIDLYFKNKTGYKKVEKLNVGFDNEDILFIFLEINISNNKKKSKGKVLISFPEWIDIQVEDNPYKGYYVQNNNLVLDLNKMLINMNESEKSYLKIACAKSEKRNNDDFSSVDFKLEGLKHIKINYNELYINYF